jgi:hypothetical protein
VTQRTRTKKRSQGSNRGKPEQTDQPRTATRDDVAVKPEHPGNIPAGTSANPVTWGEPYEADDEEDAEPAGLPEPPARGRRRRLDR